MPIFRILSKEMDNSRNALGICLLAFSYVCLHFRYELIPITDHDSFKQMINHIFTQAGWAQFLLSDTAIDLLPMASQGKPPQAHRIIVTALRLATEKN